MYNAIEASRSQTHYNNLSSKGLNVSGNWSSSPREKERLNLNCTRTGTQPVMGIEHTKQGTVWLMFRCSNGEIIGETHKA
jgi:hypothetical protein